MSFWQNQFSSYPTDTQIEVSLDAEIFYTPNESLITNKIDTQRNECAQMIATTTRFALSP